MLFQLLTPFLQKDRKKIFGSTKGVVTGFSELFRHGKKGKKTFLWHFEELLA